MLPLHTTPNIAPPFSIEKDIAFFRSVVLENESDITDEQKRQFIDIISHYEKIETVDELSLMAPQALAIFNNAHTTLLSPKIRRLPVRLHWTSNALIVVKAHPDYTHLVGHRVVKIGNETPEKEVSIIEMSAQEKTMPGDPFWDFLHLFPDNDSFETENWKTLLTNSPSLPLYLKRTDQLHTIFNLPELHAIYVRMNASFDDKVLTIDDLISN